MPRSHVHDTSSSGLSSDVILAAPFLLAIVIYLAAMAVSNQRGRRGWPWYRGVLWVAGVAAAAAGFVGPLASAAHQSFAAHMGAHLLVGMLSPLLLALAAPVTLALRTLSVVPARRVSRMLRAPLTRALTNPLLAATINVGGMWVLYLTPLYQLMQQVMVVHLLVMLHFLVAGYLYTVSLIAVDPSPHKASFAVRAAVLVLSLAAHGVLAKILYAYPLPGLDVADAHAGAQLMFYGGDAVEFALIVLLCAEWYRTTGRRLQRTPSTVSAGNETPRPSAQRDPAG